MKTKQLTKMAILAAISVVLVYLIHIPILPAVSFLEYDPADVPIMLCTFAMGPGAGFLLTVVVALIQGLTVSASSGLYGIVMHIISTGVFMIVAGMIYKKQKTKKRAILALVLGTAVWVLVMIPSNLLLTPIYLSAVVGLPEEVALATVKTLIGWIVLFNIIKAGVNSLLTFLIYKRVSGVLHK